MWILGWKGLLVLHKKSLSVSHHILLTYIKAPRPNFIGSPKSSFLLPHSSFQHQLTLALRMECANINRQLTPRIAQTSFQTQVTSDDLGTSVTSSVDCQNCGKVSLLIPNTTCGSGRFQHSQSKPIYYWYVQSHACHCNRNAQYVCGKVKFYTKILSVFWQDSRITAENCKSWHYEKHS